MVKETVEFSSKFAEHVPLLLVQLLIPVILVTVPKPFTVTANGRCTTVFALVKLKLVVKPLIFASTA